MIIEILDRLIYKSQQRGSVHKKIILDRITYDEFMFECLKKRNGGYSKVQEIKTYYGYTIEVKTSILSKLPTN